MVPFREQNTDMQQGEFYIVYVYLDFATGRIVASAKLDKFLDNVPPEYEANQPVEIIVTQKTPLGYKVIIDNLHWGGDLSQRDFQTHNHWRSLACLCKTSEGR